MNNDLEQFSEERLIELVTGDVCGKKYYSFDEVQLLARIALAAKQAKPVAQVYQPANIGICAALGPAIRMINVGLPVGTLLYTTPQPAHAEQDGWKLVPEEATIAMLTLLGMTGSFEFMQQKYKNMLAAAPKPESER